ncbi:MAG: hypothetical protein WBW28_07320, partial [Pseudolabrys sp.]
PVTLRLSVSLPALCCRFPVSVAPNFLREKVRTQDCDSRQNDHDYTKHDATLFHSVTPRH